MHPCGLGHQALDLSEDGAGLIGAVECLLPQSLLFHQARVDELFDLSLHRPERDLRAPRKLAQVEGFPNVAVQHREYCPAGASEER